MSSWSDLYLAAVLETNSDQLERLIEKTEDAIFLRLTDLEKSSDGAAERREIEKALAGLWALKTERLGWPGLEPRLNTNEPGTCSDEASGIELTERRELA
jgi:hypothetical protein